MRQRAAIYCRVSSSDQTCKRQERDLLAYSKRAGFKVIGVWKEVGSGVKEDRHERKQILALAQDHKIDIILVTELTRWGRSTIDLLNTLHDLQAWNVSLIAQTGLQFDLRTSQGKLIASMMASLAEFERDLIRERIRSGIAAAKARGQVFGRRPGQYIKSEKLTPKVLRMVRAGQSYRAIAIALKICTNTVVEIVKRDRAKKHHEE